MKYLGGCHCQKVRYEVELDLKQVMSCNCSICSKRGYLLAFAPAENFKLVSGEDSLSDYQFYKKNIHHHFCKNCGVTSFAKGEAPGGKVSYAINARCLDNVDLNQIPVKLIDGKSF